jgi:hypothetical protein
MHLLSFFMKSFQFMPLQASGMGLFYIRVTTAHHLFLMSLKVRLDCEIFDFGIKMLQKIAHPIKILEAQTYFSPQASARFDLQSIKKHGQRQNREDVRPRRLGTNVEVRGFDPRASCMRSKRSTK